MLKNLLFAVVMGTVSIGNLAFADHSTPRYPYPSQTAYELATLAEQLADGRYFDGPSLLDHRPGSEWRNVYYAADQLHHTASDLYYLLRNQGRFMGDDVGLTADESSSRLAVSDNKDHRDDGSALYALDRVTDAYNRLYYATNGYGQYYYQMNRIWDAYSQLRWQLTGNR